MVGDSSSTLEERLFNQTHNIPFCTSEVMGLVVFSATAGTEGYIVAAGNSQEHSGFGRKLQLLPLESIKDLKEAIFDRIRRC